MILRSLWFYRRTNWPVALGAAVATAVLAGALLVGDSMRGSLRELTLDRLGRIEHVLVAPNFFRTAAVEQLAADTGFARHFPAALAAITLSISVEAEGGEHPARAQQVNLWGCPRGFTRLGPGAPPEPVGPRQVVLNRPLAEQLRVGVGDVVLAHLPALSAISGDSPLGRKRETVQTQRLTVSAIIPDHGLGRFTLRPSQQAPRNAYVSLEWLQEQLDQPQRANAILVAGTDAEPGAVVEQVLARPWQPRLTDYGLRLRQAPLGYWDVTAEQMLLPPATELVLLDKLSGCVVQPTLTYLANRIVCGTREIPYSTVTAVDFLETAPWGSMREAAGKPLPPLRDDQLALNRWAADDLQARLGDTIALTFFEPESTHGQTREQTARFTLAAIVELDGAAADPGFTPEVPGVTDQQSIGDWDPPFPFDAQRIRPQDDRYWSKHRATPKAFVSLAAGRRLWTSRFGQTTALRFPADPGVTAEQWESRLALPPRAAGWSFTPLKQEGLAASAGTTPFGVLFLAFSSFTIAAAVMLVALLFRLGAESRASEIGLLLAVGIPPHRATRWLLAEGTLVVTAGSLLGMPLGIGYAALLLWGLRTWWVAAIGAPFLKLHLAPGSPLIGAAVSIVMGLLAMYFTLRRMRRLPCRALLAGVAAEEPSGAPLAWRRARLWSMALAALLLAGWAAVYFAPLDETGRAAAFFGSGAATLAALLTIIGLHLRAGATMAAVRVGRGNLRRLALRNAARNPGRSSLTIGLMAAAGFLIAAMSAFRQDPAGSLPRRDDGTGGFALVAQTDQPLFADLNTTAGRNTLGLPADAAKTLDQARIFGLRVRPGDDASCRNLYQALRPRILGVPPAFVERGGFAWASSAATTPEEKANPWRLLLRPAQSSIRKADKPLSSRVEKGSGPSIRIPVVLDQNTAIYALHLTGGVGDTYQLTDEQGRTIEFEVVGLLSNSIFQGDLLVDEAALLAAFPEVNGHRFWLIDAPPEKVQPTQAALERGLADYGFCCAPSGQRLADFLAVQNTYLSTFQSLGGLGLLLGTLGVAAVQLRNVAQRRGELALMRATGFMPATLARMVLWETGTLLLLGLGSGALAALAAVLPHVLSGGAGVPWLSLGGLLGVVILAGLLAGLAAVRAVLAAPLTPALREP